MCPEKVGWEIRLTRAGLRPARIALRDAEIPLKIPLASSIPTFIFNHLHQVDSSPVIINLQLHLLGAALGPILRSVQFEPSLRLSLLLGQAVHLRLVAAAGPDAGRTRIVVGMSNL